ncbi:MAG: WYL domain-containing protein, partial [Thermoleophilia bacterium]|nr:WYL domain-containing protein [Thermoleophilia bacterium]
GARLLVGGYALREIPVGSDEWLESEVLSKRGEAIVLEPPELRARVAHRARELASELRPKRAKTS